MPTRTVQRFCATHNAQGNPRTVYQVVVLGTTSAEVSYYDEGYRGWDALPEDPRLGTTIYLPDVFITITEYNTLRKEEGKGPVVYD